MLLVMVPALAVRDHRSEALEQHRPSAELLARAFLAAYSAPTTRAAYARDLEAWFGFCGEHRLDPLDARRAVVDAYARTLDEQGLAPATIARRLASLSSFYRYAVGEGLLTASPVEHVRRPRVADESPTLGLDRDELRRLLEAAEQAGTRDYVLVGLLALLGLRVSAACAATIDALAVERGHRTLTTTGKGGRVLRRTLPPELAAAIDELAAGRTSGPILTANDGAPLDRHDAARIVARLTRAAGITKRITPHSLRHTAATSYLEAGAPLHVVQDALGHADPRTTRRYDRARKALDRDPAYLMANYIGGQA